MPLLMLFIAVPIIEIALFIQAGELIGFWPTIAIVLLTAVIGTWLVKSQGLRVLAEVQQKFNGLQDPTEPLAHGAMVLFSGALLLTPGFFTDTLGFLLLIPAIRYTAFTWIRARVKVQNFTMGHPGRHRPGHNDQGDVVDATYYEVDPNQEIDPKKQRIPGNSGRPHH